MPITVATLRAAQSRLWTPRDLEASLYAWLDANDTNTIILNGSTVSQWIDKSGRGNTVSQATAAKQPTYSSGALSKVVFSQPNVQQLNTTSNASLPLGTQDRIIYVVWSTSSVFGSGITNGIFSYGDRVAANTGTSVGVFYENTRDQWLSINNVDAYESVNTVTNQVYLETFILSSQNVFIRKYGSPTGNGAFAYNTNAGILSVGNCAWVSGATVASNVSINEIVITGNASFPYQVVEGYLTWKWGLVSSLASNHQYKIHPPRMAV